MKISASIRKGIRLSSSDSQPRPPLNNLCSFNCIFLSIPFDLEIQFDRVLFLPVDFESISTGDLYRSEVRSVRGPHDNRLSVAVRKRLAPDPKQRSGHIEDRTELENVRLWWMIARDFFPKSGHVIRLEIDVRFYCFLPIFLLLREMDRHQGGFILGGLMIDIESERVSRGNPEVPPDASTSNVFRVGEKKWISAVAAWMPLQPNR